MKYLLIILFFLSACSTNTDKKPDVKNDGLINPDKLKIISDSSNTLTNKIENLELEYIVWGCACANWITPVERIKYKDSNLAKYCIFIEPADSFLKVPIYFSPQRHRIKVKGQFYVKEGYPQGTIETEEELSKAKVFRYFELKVYEFPLKYLAKNDTTINLIYNAIACSCAQWSQLKPKENTDSTEYIYLQRANDNLLNADTLWNGENLPLQIRVTGQFIDEVGYPTGYNPAKGNPDPARVFRYSKITVIKNGTRKL